MKLLTLGRNLSMEPSCVRKGWGVYEAEKKFRSFIREKNQSQHWIKKFQSSGGRGGGKETDPL